MTDLLDSASRQELVKYRMAKARTALDDARFCADGRRYVLAVNRLYYACFYAASALLLRDGHTAATHKGVRTLLNLHYVTTGQLSADHGRTLSRLLDSRQSGDYDDFSADYDANDYASYEPRAHAFVAAIAALIAKP